MIRTQDMTAESHPRPSIRRWIGPSGFVALAVVVLGRLLLEPARDLPRFDKEGMDAFHVVDVHRLKTHPEPFEIAALGSSVSIWGIIPEEIATSVGLPSTAVRKLAVQGGTAFDMWHLVKRNPDQFEHLKAAIVELNPRMLDDDTEGGRMRLTAAQHASFDERRLMRLKSERWLQKVDLILPIYSVRRPLKDACLNVLNPSPHSQVLPNVTQRLEPFNAGWHVLGGDQKHHYFVETVTAESTANRLYGHWRLSRLYDNSLRQLLAWFRGRDIPVLFHQPPVHPDVAAHMEVTEKETQGYASYSAYLAELDIGSPGFFTPVSCMDCDIPIHGMRDHTHLNEIGARIYSRKLGSLLRPMLEPPDVKMPVPLE